MAFVIAEPCIGTKDTACVDACPVDCIHPKKNTTYDDARPGFDEVPQLYIDPVECIDCGACVPVCPVAAIFALDDLPEKWRQYTEINASYVQGGEFTPTFDPSYDAVPIWSPDAARLVFYSNRQHGLGLFMKNSDGAQEEKGIVHDNFDKVPNDWSRDGKYILYRRGADLWFVTLPELKSSEFLKAASVLTNGQFSPDGKWVAYASNESGKWEIYVTSFPESRGKWQVSTGGGEQPRWRGDGKELFYLSSDEKMMTAPVTIGTSFNAGTPIALFPATPRQAISRVDLFVYDVSRDGQRFLILTQMKQAETAPMSVVLNWSAKLNK